MERKNVYNLIDGERDYQNSKWPQGRPKGDEECSVAEWLIFMEKCLNDAKNNIYNLKESEALSCIRKVTALGVACMEYNETESRK
jgi:hypothetical protein